MQSTGTHMQWALTRSGFSRSLMAVPSARNSGLDRISKCTLGSTQLRRRTCDAERLVQHIRQPRCPSPVTDSACMCSAVTRRT